MNLCSPDHISLLVHRTFNVSIPRYHIPTDEWEFEYGPAANDPEFGADAVGENGEEADEGEGKQEETGGRWVHKVTGEKLGGPDGFLEFTVVGYDFCTFSFCACRTKITDRLTVANEMLSLLGSIQYNPFSPEHAPSNGRAADSPRPGSEEEVAQIAVEGTEDDESDEGAFSQLGRMRDEAAREAERKAEAEKKEKKEKKRQRKGTTENGNSTGSNKPKRKKI